MTIPATATLVDLDALLVGANAAAARLAAIGTPASARSAPRSGRSTASRTGSPSSSRRPVPRTGRLGLAASPGAVEALAEKGDALTSWPDILSDVVSAIAGHVTGLEIGGGEVVDPAEGIGPAIDPAGESAGVYLGDILVAAVGFVAAAPPHPGGGPGSGRRPDGGGDGRAAGRTRGRAGLPGLLRPDPVASEVRRMHLLRDVEMGVSVELGRTRMAVRDLLGLAPGAIVELDKAAGAPVDVLVNGTLMARGQVVVIDEEFAVRISEIVSPEQGDQLGA